MGKGRLLKKELMHTAQKMRVKKWCNAPKSGIARACSLELERNEQSVLVIFFGFFLCLSGLVFVWVFGWGFG